MLKRAEGDLIKMFKEGQFDVIVHGCNCYNVMGAGIALQIAREFPEAEEADQNTVRGSLLKMGAYAIVETAYGLVINAYTQRLPGKENPLYLESAIEDIFAGLNDNESMRDKKIGIPKIGCGLAGGDWEIISDIILKSTPNLDITYVEYNK